MSNLSLRALSSFSKRGFVLFMSIVLVFIHGKRSYSQDTAFSRKSLKTAIGIGFNEGHNETGMGLIYSIGWQKSFGEKNKLRINPNLMFGGFLPLGITDTRDQFYRITSLGFNFHYDLIRYKAVSLVTTAGGFINYSRGLLGTGGWPEEGNNHSDYFFRMYFGGNASVGIRIDPKQGNLAYEVRPFNFQFGNDDFVLSYLMFGIDFKLKK